MKTLYLVRHAKSSWTFDLPDHDRPLGKRGRKDVIRMGDYLAKKEAIPDVMLCSTASRAFYTALFFCDRMGLDEGTIYLRKELFHAYPDQILSVLKSAPEVGKIGVFGHNPGLTTFYNLLAKDNRDNIPTCGVSEIALNIKSWSSISYGAGKETAYYIPKEIRSY